MEAGSILNEGVSQQAETVATVVGFSESVFKAQVSSRSINRKVGRLAKIFTSSAEIFCKQRQVGYREFFQISAVKIRNRKPRRHAGINMKVKQNKHRDALFGRGKKKERR